MHDLDFHITGFLAYIETEKGLSRNTVEAYFRDIRYFKEFLKKKTVIGFQDVNQSHIIEYLSFLKTSYASSSIARIFITLKVFFRFLKKEDVIKTDITRYLDYPKTWQFLPTVMTFTEVESLLNQPDIKNFIGARDKAIIETLYATGIRVTEACNIKIIDVFDNFIKVCGKGKKHRIVPIGQKAIEAIEIAIPTIASALPLSFGRLYLINTKAEIPIITDKGHGTNVNSHPTAGT